MKQIKFRVWDKKEKKLLPKKLVVKDIGQKDESKYPNPIRAYHEINILIDRDGNICAFEYDIDNGWKFFDIDYDRFEIRSF